MGINRRAFLASSVALASPVFPGILRHARAAVTLMLAHGAAPTNPRAVAARHFASLVEEKTAGAVKVNIAGSEQLGSDAAMLTSLRIGAIDFSINSQGPTSAIIPEMNVLGLPFMFRDAAQAFRVLQGPVGQTLVDALAARDLVLLGWWDNGIRHVTNSKRPIQKPADLRGLKLRVPADAMLTDIFRTLGATTEQIAFGELYLALQQGVVDGQENPLANIESAKIHEVNRFISLTGHAWQCNPFMMSPATPGKLGRPELDAIRAAAEEAGARQRQSMEEADLKLLDVFRSRKNVQINEPDRDALREATASVYDTWKKKPFGRIVQQTIDAVAAAG
ncbi:MAG: TRAP transporter substrate-binding protein [Lautropia sp.]|nr:TRAP transporter substrate-binding protein [Lautropia sp.]